MNRLTSTLLAITLAASAGWAADPPEKKEVPLPAPVIKAEDAMNDAVNKARSVYIKAVEAEVKKLQAALEKEKQAATKAGNLELAMAIKAKQEAMTVDAVVAKGAESGGDLLGEGKTDLDTPHWIGVWNITNITTLKISKDGTAFWGSTPGTYTVGENTIKFSWGNEIDIPKSSKCKVVDHGRNGVIYDIVITKK